jgi:hypothetical protein
MPSDCEGPITFGRVLPMQAILDYIDNAADDAPLVDARQAGAKAINGEIIDI